jgi:hypothetical protein
MKAYTMVAVASFAAVLTGCATGLTTEQRTQLDAANKQTTTDRWVQQRIAESSGKIERTMELIDRIERGSPGKANDRERAAEPVAGASAASKVSSPLDARLNIRWSKGPADQLLSQLAKQLGVGFKVTGQRKPLPLVSVDSRSERAESVLRSVGRQIDAGADVVFDRAQQPAVLELRYK